MSMTQTLDQLSTPHPLGFREVSPANLDQSGYQGRVIDVREPSEFTGELGHLRNAELVPLATLVAVAASWNRAEPLVLVCRSGGRSGRAAQQLATLGFRKLYNLSGGMLAHGAAGLPVSRE